MVDDEKHVLKALKRVFIEEDYKIITAENASDGLSAMAVNNVNLIISDYQMPGMSGIELLKIVKERHPNTIRIMLTGAADTSIEMGR
jgi:YesN/AraC family two-component response regulator